MKRMANALKARNQDICAEILLIVMSCFAPWAYGSVDASSEYILYGCLFTIVVLRTIADWRSGERSLGSGPLYWALVAIVGIAVFQALPLSEGVIRIVSPGTLQARSAVLANPSLTVLGDSLPPVAAPASTISIDPNETRYALVRLAAIFLLFDCAARARFGYLAFEWFAKSLVFNSTLLAMFSLAQGVTWNGKIYWIREANFSYPWGGPFFCHNHLAAYLNIGLGLSLGLLFANIDSGQVRERRKLGRFFLIYAAGLITVGLIGSQSRGGVIAMVVSSVIVLAMSRIRPSRILPVLAAILGLSILFMLFIGSSSSSLARLGTIAESFTTGLHGRDEVWKSALETSKAYPVLGSGFGTYAEAAYPTFHPAGKVYYNRFVAHGESEYVEMLVEAGLVGLGILFVIIFDLLRKTWTALKIAPKAMQPLILGGLFGVVAIATQSLADFPLHVAGVTVPAVILASKLYRLASSKPSAEQDEQGPTPPSSGQLAVTAKNAVFLAVACAVIYYQAFQVKLEHLMERSRLPLPGTRWVTIDIPEYSKSNLETMKTALTEALKIRPDWTEGHARLGQVQLGLYRHAAADAMGIQVIIVEPDIKAAANGLAAAGGVDETPAEEKEPESKKEADEQSKEKTPSTANGDPVATSSDAAAGKQAEADKPPSTEPAKESEAAKAPEMPSGSAAQADPLWLQKIVHLSREQNPEQVNQLLEHEPVRDFLIPAARSFLEARRCCPFLGVPHLQLASLDYLLVGGEQVGLNELKIGVSLKGNHARMLMVGAEIAVNFNDIELARRYWREYLQARPDDWAMVAHTASTILPASQVLEVAKGGGVKGLFFIGSRFYPGPTGFLTRVRFMEAALAELPNDPTLGEEEKLWFEGLVRGELAQYGLARQLLRKALDLQPMNEARRLEYIDTLMAWKCPDEAYRLALMGSRLFPRNGRYTRLMKICLNAALESGLPPKQLSASNQDYDR